MTHVRERPKAHSSDQAEKMAFTIHKIGVIGAGQMGNGIAHVAALAGMDVLLNDISSDRINAGLATINGNLTRQVSRKLISEEDRQAALARITPAETLDKLGDADLVIESASEKEEVKRKIFSDLCPHLKPDAIIGSRMRLTMKAGKSSATAMVFFSLATNSLQDSKVVSAVAMPRMSSTSSISGTGFMKWMPMNFSGRSVEAASRVIEIDEVLVPRIACSAKCGQTAA
jgi:hypothetical protein